MAKLDAIQLKMCLPLNIESNNGQTSLKVICQTFGQNGHLLAKIVQ